MAFALFLFCFLFLITSLLCEIFAQPLPAEEEKELKEALLHILGNAKNVKIEQKVTSCIFKKILVLLVTFHQVKRLFDIYDFAHLPAG